MSTQDYTVNYRINVDATPAANEIKTFAESMGKLMQSKETFGKATENINGFVSSIDKIFRPNGKKRDYSLKFEIDTKSSEEKLVRIKALLGEIKSAAEGIKVIVNPGEPLKNQQLKSNAKDAYTAKATGERDAEIKKNAAESVKTMMSTQKMITKSIGKVNSALVSLEKGRELKINTDVAKKKLQEIVSLMNKIRSGTTKMMTIPTPKTGVVSAKTGVPYASGYLIPPKQAEMLMSRQQDTKTIDSQKEQINKLRSQLDTRALNNVQRQVRANETSMTNQQRAAINRMQYVRRPSLRSLPFMSMLNAYMVFGFLKSELGKAVEYENLMTSARSILKVADNDLGTFETRFASMSQNVRQIGLDTKFTAVEIAGAAKYLAMAGMDIDMINKSMRPITNLALIGDNDVALIADLATNIMAGYNIKGDSMGSVADVLATTVSRSNVNIVSMAESYKMAAGFLKMAGVDFSESAAAIGVLGNSGIKGTMAGTALRSMSQRFAKPTKEGRTTLKKLGVSFTEFEEVLGNKIEKLRPLADIFEDLKKKGASMADMQAIFGRIGGNAAMMFLNNYEKLREIASHNRASYGISGELAEVKQNTTKGLWSRVTSQLTESFMLGYETLEPILKSTLRSFLTKFKAPELARGITAIGQAIVNILSLLGNLATWFARNYHWIEPVLFTGFVATKLFKLAGAITNVGVAMGFLGKQSAASSALQLLGGLSGMRMTGALPFANKRAIVGALQSAGISGKGAMSQVLASIGVGGVGRGVGSLFSSQVATGGGLVGAGASISALGTGAVIATAGIVGLVAAIGYATYKTWQLKQAKDAVQEEIDSNKKYRYPSIDALYTSLSNTYRMAIATKREVDNVTSGKTLGEDTGISSGWFSGPWWKSLGSYIAQGGSGSTYGGIQYTTPPPIYSFAQGKQDAITEAIDRVAEKDSQARINSAFAELGKATTPVQVGAFMQNIQSKYGQTYQDLDYSLIDVKDHKVIYRDDVLKRPAELAAKTQQYADYHNKNTVPEITRAAQVYKDAISTTQGARDLLAKGNFDFSILAKKGFVDNNGIWTQLPLGKNPTEKEREDHLANQQAVHHITTQFIGSLRNTFGGSGEAAETIMRKAGFSPNLYSNEPDFKDPDPWNANRITNDTGDDGDAGGNYSGTGKLSSAAPKQVIVNISNLLSVQTIDLMKTPEGKEIEVQNLKQQLAQALIDVVHDFDASWNG